MNHDLKHITDPWGYYCEDTCPACKIDKYKCFECGTVYGSGQWHTQEHCQRIFAAEAAKQLEFTFMSLPPWKK